MTTVDELPCPTCGVALGEHTLAAYRDHTAIDLPFTPLDRPVEYSALDQQVVVDHAEVASMVIKVPTGNDRVVVLPGVEFRFHSTSTGLQVAPILFVADNPEMFKALRQLVSAACDAAPMRATQEVRKLQRDQGDAT